jgi:hypothetical protein
MFHVHENLKRVDKYKTSYKTYLSLQGFGSLTITPSTMTASSDRNAHAAPVASDTRLADLRKAMGAVDKGKGVAAFIVPTEDPHMSEYSPACFTRREFITRQVKCSVHDQGHDKCIERGHFHCESLIFHQPLEYLFLRLLACGRAK